MSKYSVAVRELEDRLMEADAVICRLERENAELRRYLKDYKINLQRALDSLEPPTLG